MSYIHTPFVQGLRKYVLSHHITLINLSNIFKAASFTYQRASSRTISYSYSYSLCMGLKLCYCSSQQQVYELASTISLTAKSTTEALVLKVGLHFAPFTKQIGKLVPTNWSSVCHVYIILTYRD